MTETGATLTALREAYKTRKASAVISAGLAQLPRGASLTFESNFRTGAPEWHLQVLCGGCATNVRVGYHAGLAALAALLDAARTHAVEAHGFNPNAVRVRPAVHVARCEDCGKTLSGFDLEGSSVTHLCFDCA